RGDYRAVGLQLVGVRPGLVAEARRQLTAQPAQQLGGQLGELPAILGKALLPFVLPLAALLARAPALVQRLRNLEWRMRPAQRLTGRDDLVLAQRRAVRAFLAGLAGRAEADGGPAADQHRALVLRHRGADRLRDLLRVVTVDIADHQPAIGL